MTAKKVVCNPSDLSIYLRDRSKLIEKYLRQALPSSSVKPKIIHRAMRYSLMAGGKRLRPILTLAGAEACGMKDIIKLLPVACGVEFIHTYSLIHDDLPSLDNDDFRRGVPSSHKIFGNGMAILAGDALLTRAFALIGMIQAPRRYPLAIFLQETSTAAGSLQMIAGQAADLEAKNNKQSLREIRFIHERKTAALIVLALRLGAMAANATTVQLNAITEFGKALGLAFQIIDDILDVTESTQQLGKSAGQDMKNCKPTYPSVIGLRASSQEATRLTQKAHEALRFLGKKSVRLSQIADHLLNRSF